MKLLVIVLCCIQACFAASIGSGALCPLVCPQVHNPICGSDGKTYTNDCYFNRAQCQNTALTISHRGSCSVLSSGAGAPLCQLNVFCIDLWDPVCGSDGVTYSNQCRLNSHNCGTHRVTLAHKGACGGGAIAG